MKKSILLAVALALAGAVSSFAQGTILFQYVAGSGIAVGTPTQATPAHATGWFCGSDYSVAAWMGPANTVDDSLLTMVPATMLSFIGNPTSAAGGPSSDGAGLFSSGVTVVVPFAISSTATIQVRAWYNGGSFATYQASADAGKNVGKSLLYQIGIADPTSPVQADLDSVGMAAFTVKVVPEPSTFALLGFGLLGLFLRRK